MLVLSVRRLGQFYFPPVPPSSLKRGKIEAAVVLRRRLRPPLATTWYWTPLDVAVPLSSSTRTRTRPSKTPAPHHVAVLVVTLRAPPPPTPALRSAPVAVLALEHQPTPASVLHALLMGQDRTQDATIEIYTPKAQSPYPPYIKIEVEDDRLLKPLQVPPRYVFRRSMSPVPSYTTTYAIPRFTRAYSPVVISVSRLRSFPSFAIYSAPIRRPRATSPLLNYKRIVQVPIVSSRVGRNAAYLAEMNRIGHRLRPRVGSEPCEDFLNSKAIVSFDDETRAIRARTKELLRRMLMIWELEYTPEPLSHDEYIEQRVFSPMRHVHQDISTMSRFNEPARQYIGKGHLACISFAGGRPMDRRRAMPRCEEDRNVRDDIKFLSHYNRARAAAVGPVASLDAIKGGPSKETAAPEATCISCNSNCATAAYKKANETAEAAVKTP
ncbi:hypothetical protein B566_EDAN008627 [Ephemera danica]|nr:hypothetical protein B566_EDAN008627 [Ephemera danica]